MRNPRQVLGMFAWLSLLMVLVIGTRFFYIQIIKSDHFQEKVAEQRVKEIPEPPERGKIVDRNENVMAISLTAQDINVYPNLITSEARQQKVAKLLSDTLDLPYEEVLKKVSARDKNGKLVPWMPIAKRVDLELVKKIKAADLGGIEYQRSLKRYYTNGATGGSIIGFVNHENLPGSGIELSMNSYLSGVPGYTIAETDNVGNVIPVGFENISSPIDGQQVKLTIDSYLQYVLEKRLAQAQEEMEPVSMHAVLMNPKTGEVVAMASTPSFDPNKYGEADPATWTNNAASFVYEPGSTFKPVYMAMALDGGFIHKDSTWYDGKGSISVQGSWIKNWDGKALGDMNLRDIITNSSNVGMIEISKTMTNKQIVEGLKKAGFGKATGIQLPGEEVGLFPNASEDKNDFNSLNNDPIRKATLSFGQGISITPIQLTTAFSEVINGGHELDPTIVSEVKDETGNILYQADTSRKERKYKPDTVELMKSYLEANMVEGSGKDYQLEGYDSGGKTGSAWVVENGLYKKGVIIGSFIGFAPLENPEFALLVVVNQPKNQEFGGPSAGPIWHDVMAEALRYSSTPKSSQPQNAKGTKEKEVAVPNVNWLLYEDAKATLEQTISRVKVEKEGTGQVVYGKEYRYKNNQLHVTLKTKPLQDKRFLYMPDVHGKTKEEVQRAFKNSGMTLKFHGTGTVKEQKVPHGRQPHTNELIFWLTEEG